MIILKISIKLFLESKLGTSNYYIGSGLSNINVKAAIDNVQIQIKCI